MNNELKLEKKIFTSKIINFQRTKKGYPVFPTGKVTRDNTEKYVFLYNLNGNEKLSIDKKKFKLSFLETNDLIIKIYKDNIGIGFSVFYVQEIFNMNNRGRGILLIRKSPQDNDKIWIYDLKSSKDNIKNLNDSIISFLLKFFKEKSLSLFNINYKISGIKEI